MVIRGEVLGHNEKGTGMTDGTKNLKQRTMATTMVVGGSQEEELLVEEVLVDGVDGIIKEPPR